MNTAEKLISSARTLIIERGYHGFSYADVADVVNIRKASIHHHFPTKSDLAQAVVEQSLSVIRAQIATLAAGAFDPKEQLGVYVAYWERCISTSTDPFCVAGILATELPSLPPALADVVRTHFADLSQWLETVLTQGAAKQQFLLKGSARQEAESFLTTIYGAMLMARAFGNPRLFANVVGEAVGRLSV
ncbi:TetR/AcrR family transcriptional regulator [Dyella sp.]|uniref:TetR/AcrR family transcriptional regulator n=1 Tax=Dyella sp. TaxID=1869338 RepID=UPI002ED4F455